MRFLLCVLAPLLLASCAIPVRNENNDKPMLVATVGTSVPQADGSTAHNPGLPQPKADDYKPSMKFDWMLLLQAGAVILFGTTGGAAVSKIRTLANAVKDAAAFGDDMENAVTDDEVKQVKARNSIRQYEHGTFKTIAKQRNKV